jgi:hypothetical protein
VESNWVHSALRPLIGLFCQPRVIMMLEKLVEWLAGETEVLEKICPSAALSTTNPTCCRDEDPGRRGGKPASNRLSYGTATILSSWRFQNNNYHIYIFFLIGIVGGGVQFGPLNTAATNRPIVPAPGDYDDGEIVGMMDWQVIMSYAVTTWPSAALSTTNPTCCPDADLGRRGAKPATKRLSYCTA